MTKVSTNSLPQLSPNARRHFLRLGAAAVVAGVLPLPQLGNQNVAHATVPATKQLTWRNWSAIEECKPSSLQTPGNEAEILQLLQSTQGPLRCVGSGHSFSALVPTTGHLISLDKLAGIVNNSNPSNASNASTISVRAGTRLAQFSRQLDERKLALRNLPDIDQQTIAGALATATHGTGADLPALHADVLEMRIVAPNGKVFECNRNAPQLLEAARVSLGCLGVVSEVTMRVVPAFNLQRKVWLRPIEEMLGMAQQLANQHRHFEFYYLPFTGFAAAITHDLYTGTDVSMPHASDEEMLRDLRRLRDWAGSMPSLRRWLAKKLIDPKMEEHAKNRSFKLLASSRPTIFNEAECHVPRHLGIECVKEVIAKLEQRNEVFFPLEFRFVKADDAWLSPFYQRDTCSIAVHAAQGEPYDYLTREIGPIFRKFQGRPHWGKLHNFSAKELAALYPRWYDFQEIRRSFDPQGRMLNPHLRQLFGIAA